MKPSTYIRKENMPDGKVKYIYLKGKSPQDKYYNSTKGKNSDLRHRNSEKRKVYLKNYYQNNRQKMIDNTIKNYYKNKND